MVFEQACIIAYTTEDDRYSAVRRAAEAAAMVAEARLILFDADAAGRFGEPLPSNWSGEDARGVFPEDVLEPNDLETAGRHAIAAQVREARDRGIDAWGWLPKSKDANAIAEYADKRHADLVMLPKDHESPGLLARIRGEASVDEAAKKLGRPVAVVDDDGNVEYR